MLLCVHEAVHVYQKILASMSDCEFQGNEFAAYTIQWCADRMFSEVMKYTK